MPAPSPEVFVPRDFPEPASTWARSSSTTPKPEHPTNPPCC